MTAIGGAERVLADARSRPAHAYLLVGPRGSGVEAAARELAAALVAPGDERALRLARRGHHPDIVEFEPVARTYSVRDDVRPRILPEAHRSPVEGDRKVLVLLESDRLEEAANALLKTLEEPPERTTFVLVTDTPDRVLETVRSRCRRIDFPPLGDDAVRDALVGDGVEAGRAELAAALAGGHLARARVIAGPLAGVRDAFVDALWTLDGTGAPAALGADRARDAVQEAVAALDAAHAREAEELEAELASAGYPERTARAQRRRLEERQKRAARRARTEAILEGITAIESVYRDALTAPAPVRNLDREVPEVDPAAAAAALDRCREARAAFETTPNEGLLLEWLLLQLPPVTGGRRRARR